MVKLSVARVSGGFATATGMIAGAGLTGAAAYAVTADADTTGYTAGRTTTGRNADGCGSGWGCGTGWGIGCGTAALLAVEGANIRITTTVRGANKVFIARTPQG
jgi:hypothetical protein